MHTYIHVFRFHDFPQLIFELVIILIIHDWWSSLYYSIIIYIILLGFKV